MKKKKKKKKKNDLLSLAASADTPAKPVPKSLKAITAGILKPSPVRTRSRVKVKNLALVNPLPILKQKFQECVMAGKETGASAVNAKFKKQAQSLSDKVSTLVKSRPPVEFETLLEDFDVYKKSLGSQDNRVPGDAVHLDHKPRWNQDRPC